MKRRSTRRSFLGQAGLGLAGLGLGGLTILPSARAAFGFAANERLRLAVFGSMYNAQHFLVAAHTYNAEITAICNADQRKIPAVLKMWGEQADKLSASPKPEDRLAAQRYAEMAERKGVIIADDVRRLFRESAERIDALVVSDYDHFHGVACGAALRAGKPVCSERPLGFNIGDARDLRALAAETKLPTTYRSPGTGVGQFRRAMELVEDGVIGPVKEVHVWLDRGGPDRDALPNGSQPVPEGLNWDLWLGPLAWREYHPDWMSYSHWRETCNGGLGVFGMHASIFPFMALALRELWDAADAEITVEAECSRRNRVSFPRWERVRWELPARKSMPPVTIHWHHGPGLAPGSRELIRGRLGQFGLADAKAADALMASAGSMLIGADGALVGNDHSTVITALPKEKFEKIETNRPQRIPATQGIYKDWIEACRGQKRHIIAGFDIGGPLSELLMLGNIATQFDRQLVYRPKMGQIVGDEAANALLRYKYREGWTL